MSAYHALEWVVVIAIVVGAGAYAWRQFGPKPKDKAAGCGSCDDACAAKDVKDPGR